MSQKQIKLIGIFGGTFDPIHLGHLHLAKTILQQVDLQHILFIPCYQSPHRPLPFASAQDRLAMIKLAIANQPKLKVNTYELKNEKISYTIETLQHLRQNLPLDEKYALCLIIGNDEFAKFHLWHKWQEILKLCHLIVATRHDIDTKTKNISCANKILDLPPNFPATLVSDQSELSKKLHGYVWFTDIKPLDISATTIRRLIKVGKSVEEFLPHQVYKYINEHGLYR